MNELLAAPRRLPWLLGWLLTALPTAGSAQTPVAPPVQSAALPAAQAPTAPDPRPLLALATAWQQALARHPALAGARAQIAAAEAREDFALAPRLPQAQVDVSHSQQTANFASRPGALPRSTGGTEPSLSPELFAYWQATASGRWNAWDFGRTEAQIRAAELGADAARGDAEALRRQLWLQVTTAYVRALAAESTVASLLEARDQAARHRDQARVMVEAQVRPRLDLLKAESDLAAAEVAVLRAEEEVRASRVALGVAIGTGRAPAERLEPPVFADPLLQGEALDGDAGLDALVAEAAKVRPELEALSARIAAETATLDAVRKAALPSLFVSAQASLAGTQVDELAYNYGISGGVSWPFSNAWAQPAAWREQRARVRVLEAQRDAELLRLRDEIEAARTSLVQSRKRLPALRTLVEFATTARSHADTRYTAGAATLIELSDAETVLVQARIQLIQAELEVVAASARLLRAVGRAPGAT